MYFDKRVVNAYVTPSASGAVGTTHGSFSDVAVPVAGSTLISDGVGNCEGVFTIPDPKLSGNPRFATGDIEFVITADPNNSQVGDGANEIVARQTFADATYSAKGLLDTQQETITSTRNAIVKTSNLTENSGLIIGRMTGGGGGGARAGTIAVQLVLDDGRARAVVIALEAIIYFLVVIVAYCVLLLFDCPPL